MSTKQIQDEKLHLQKILLKYEAIFGKPVNVRKMNIQGPIRNIDRTIPYLVDHSISNNELYNNKSIFT